MEWSFYREEFLSRVEKMGLKVEVKNLCLGRNDPKPAGDHFREATIDALPVKNTNSEFCSIEANPPYGGNKY